MVPGSVGIFHHKKFSAKVSNQKLLAFYPASLGMALHIPNFRGEMLWLAGGRRLLAPGYPPWPSRDCELPAAKCINELTRSNKAISDCAKYLAIGIKPWYNKRTAQLCSTVRPF
jgi:hypothetical protein